MHAHHPKALALARELRNPRISEQEAAERLAEILLVERLRPMVFGSGDLLGDEPAEATFTRG